jgi:hypothetical protein
MSARRKIGFFDVLGGLTSSSDARAHQWWSWGNVSRSRLFIHGGSFCHSRCAGQNTLNVKDKIVIKII